MSQVNEWDKKLKKIYAEKSRSCGNKSRKHSKAKTCNANALLEQTNIVSSNCYTV